jgi:leucyl/phenylalanyl-tRNA--protein transferase
LLAAGGALDVPTLLAAYRQGIFPWFNDGQPTLWWCPGPRMVLRVQDFRLHRSLRKTLQRFVADPSCEVRFDSAFVDVIRACAGRDATWIGPGMIDAYTALHHAGHAHSVETWRNGELVGGLYLISIGQAVFGESMFTRQTDASKIALAGLIAFCRAQDLPWVDCQMNTGHLASMGAAEMPRDAFVQMAAQASQQPAPGWRFQPLYWTQLLSPSPTASRSRL